MNAITPPTVGQTVCSTDDIRTQFELWFYENKNNNWTPSFLKSIRCGDIYVCPSISVASINWAWLGFSAAVEIMEV